MVTFTPRDHQKGEPVFRSLAPYGPPIIIHARPYLHLPRLNVQFLCSLEILQNSFNFLDSLATLLAKQDLCKAA